MSERHEVYSKEKCDEILNFVSTDQGKKSVNVAAKFYDLVTDFYLAGWGRSFHFAPQKLHEKKADAILRHQHFLGKNLGLKPGIKALDVGCGVGGPMMSLAKKFGANIEGITICKYQISKGKRFLQEEKLEHLCSFFEGNFMNIARADATYDVAYAFEATPHAPDRVECFRQIFRVLKPGGLFGGYEWIVKDNYDSSNPTHKKMIDVIEHGNAIQKLPTLEEVKQALIMAGFEVMDIRDVCTDDLAWSTPLWKPFVRSKLARFFTDMGLKISEKFGWVPKGSVEVCKYLEKTAADLVESEKLKIFSPTCYFLARKPA